ncbi:DUF4276 family protein [Actinosynnema sp. NPDC050801]|uniref:DUF4276 family protein n=1 Tax=unclassified Actinosynnema TaxID=2637065 RepID=UPI00341078C1
MTGAIRRVHLLVEGQTEEVVADSVIRPHLEGLGWVTSLSLVKTKRPAAGPSHKGGITGWGQVQRDIRLLLNDTSLDVSAGGPELVNDGPATAPSKRLLDYCPGYVKTVDGPLAIQDLGLARLRAACPHLDAWLRTFEE